MNITPGSVTSQTTPNVDALFDRILSVFSSFDEQEIAACVMLHYRCLGMRNTDGWTVAEFDQVNFTHVSKGQMLAHWQRVKAGICKDRSLVEFIESVTDDVRDELRANIDRHTKEELLEIFSFGYALERLNVALLDSPKLFIRFMQHLKRQPTASFRPRWLAYFVALKKYLVGLWIFPLCEVFEGRRSLTQTSGQMVLKINILEAALFEWIKGSRDNAYAGRVLARHEVGGGSPGSGSTALTSDGKRVHLRAPLPSFYKSVYSTWNFAFTSLLSSFLITVQKLFIPSVFDLDDDTEYMHRRVLALYLTLRYYDIKTTELGGESKTLQWHSPKLTAALGKYSRAKALAYRQQVAVRLQPAA